MCSEVDSGAFRNPFAFCFENLFGDPECVWKTCGRLLATRRHYRNVFDNCSQCFKSFANWLPCANQKQLHFNLGPLRASIGRKLPWPLEQSTIKTITVPLQPTNWERHRMIARTHHATFLMCGDFVQKPLLFQSSMPLQSTNGRLLDHRISHTVLGSQNALIKVCEVFRLQPAVIAALPSLHPQRHSNTIFAMYTYSYFFPAVVDCLK